MTKFSPQVFFRSILDAPTEEGIYYGRAKGTKNQPTPKQVYRALAMGQLSVETIPPSNCTVNSFDWFGPVPECREASQ